MAKFVYSLNGVLNIKGKLEEQKKLEFGQAVTKLEEEKEKKRVLLSKKNANISLFKQKLNESVDPEDIKIINQYTELLKKRVVEQDKVIEIATEFMEKKRAELTEAMKERKKYEKLKEKQYEEYLITEKRNEQRIIDGVVTYKHTISKD